MLEFLKLRSHTYNDIEAERFTEEALVRKPHSLCVWTQNLRQEQPQTSTESVHYWLDELERFVALTEERHQALGW